MGAARDCAGAQAGLVSADRIERHGVRLNDATPACAAVRGCSPLAAAAFRLVLLANAVR